jgi:hypothetical protein
LQRAKKQAQPNSWDEGVIYKFMNEPETHGYAVDLVGGGKLIIYTQESHTIPNIASETDALFTWLGVPQGFTMILFWRHDPRRIAATEWPSKRTVNGGWAVPGSAEITVYRAEEWDRVLLHESIHALEWDWAMPESPLPCWGLHNKASVQPALFEAWTELFAEWMWCGWHNVPWERQRSWQDYQATQILRRAPHVWKENTNLFAYYVLKAALAPHIGFLWVFGNGNSGPERLSVLCGLVEPELTRLRQQAMQTHLEAISMRMTVSDKFAGA